MKYKAVIFDLDGTLLDTLDDLADSVNFALKNNNMPERETDEIRGFVGNGIGKLMERSIPSGRENLYFDKAFADFKSHYEKNCRNKTKPYDKIMPMLEKLKENNIKLAIVSNKADFAVQKLSEDFFEGLIDFSVGEREGIRRKPAPDSVNEVLKILDISKEEAVYVGDSDVDIQTAKNAGLKCISVSWGFKGRKFLEAMNAEIIIDSPDEIINIL